MTHMHHRAVVVGADGSLPARRAVGHAAAEAARRGCPLRIVTAAWTARRPEDGGPRHRLTAWSLEEVDVTLAEAVDLAAETLPRGEITTVTGIGAPVGVLLAEARTAELLVIGNRGLGGVTGLFLGSVGVELAGRTACPLLIVRQPPPGGGGAQAPVVVGVDGSPRSLEALRTAFREAELVGAPLVAVHAWHAPVLVGAGRIPALAYRSEHRPADEQVLLDALLAPFRDEHPSVRASGRAVQGKAADVLVEAAAGARLLVVAARGRGELSGLVLGSTSQDAIHRAGCPVLLVGDGRRGGS